MVQKLRKFYRHSGEYGDCISWELDFSLKVLQVGSLRAENIQPWISDITLITLMESLASGSQSCKMFICGSVGGEEVCVLAITTEDYNKTK